MKKIKLRTEYNYDFYLFGIVSKSKEYSLTWSINKSSGLGLIKMDDLVIDIKNDQQLQVSNYYYQTESSTYYLINNRLITDLPENPALLAPSLKSFDYILKMETETGEEEVENLFSQIRTAENIDMIVKLDVNKIKEKENFLF